MPDAVDKYDVNIYIHLRKAKEIMLNPKAIKTISDLREDPLGVIKAAQELGEPVCVVYRATPVGVLMDLVQYSRFRQILEDYHDATLIKKTMEDPTVEWVPLDTLWKDHGFATKVPADAKS